MTSSIAKPSDSPLHARNVFLLTIWFGIVSGLGEGAAFALFDRIGWLTWHATQEARDLNLFWAAVLVNVTLFSLAGLVLAVVVAWVRSTPLLKAVIGALSAFAVFPALSVTGRIDLRAAAILALGLGVAISRWCAADLPERTRMLRRSLPAVAALALIVGAGVRVGYALHERADLAALGTPPANAPNVLVVVLDTARADRLGAYGYQRETTPFLDSFAATGVTFEQAFANAPWSLPSHASLFTGRLPGDHGANISRYDGRFPTIAEHLRQAGYATVGIVANGGTVTRATGLDRGFIRWENAFTGAVDSIRRTAFGGVVVQHLYRSKRFRLFVREPGEMDAAEINMRFLRWLDDRPKRPFFAFLNYMEAHPPLAPRKEFLERVRRHPGPTAHLTAIERYGTTGQMLKMDVVARLNDDYDACLAYLDDQLRQLFDAMEQRGVLKHTLVVITSDHGELIGDHGLFGHQRSLYRQEIHVPLIMRFKGRAPEGRRIAQAVGLDQIAPTIAQAVGLSGLGYPRASLLEPSALPPDGSGGVVSQVAGGTWPGVEAKWPIHQGWLASLMAPPWHLIVGESGTVELFNTESDPGEHQNRADEAPFTTTSAALTEQLRHRLGGGRDALNPDR